MKKKSIMVTEELTPNEVQSKKAAKKLAAKADKAAKKADKASTQQQENVDEGEDFAKDKYGIGKLIQSDETYSERNFVSVNELSKATSPSVWVRGRIHNSRCKGKQCFIVLRQQSSTVQVLIYVNENISKQMVKFSGS